MKLTASDIGPGRQRASELLLVLVVALVCVPVSALAQICNMTDVAPSFGSAPLTVHFRAAPTDCERNRDKQFWLVGSESTNSLGWSTTFYNPGDYTWEFCSWLPGCIQCCDSGTIHVSSPPCQLDCTPTATATPTTTGVRACTSISDSTEIPDNDPAGITSRITVDQPGIIDRVRVVLRIQHTWVGDLVVTLTRQQDATTVVLLDRPGYPADSYGCSGDNIDCEFNDSALLPAEDACSEEGPALQGALEPAEPLAEFAGGELAGTWVLRVIDQAPGDVGQFLEWCLDADASR
jgi:subtilisin-like proprotein convertase family protein